MRWSIEYIGYIYIYEEILANHDEQNVINLKFERYISLTNFEIINLGSSIFRTNWEDFFKLKLLFRLIL